MLFSDKFFTKVMKTPFFLSLCLLPPERFPAINNIQLRFTYKVFKNSLTFKVQCVVALFSRLENARELQLTTRKIYLNIYLISREKICN